MTGHILGASLAPNESDGEDEDMLPENDDVPDLPQYRGRLNRLLLPKGTWHRNFINCHFVRNLLYFLGVVRQLVTTVFVDD